MRRSRAGILAAATIVAVGAVAFTTLNVDGRSGGSAAACRVTLPNGKTPPNERPSKIYHGQDGLWVGLETDGHVTVENQVEKGVGLQQDGSIQWKYPWYGARSTGRRLRMSVRRAYSPSKMGRARVLQGAEASAPRFWSSYAEFTSPGCWRVVGQAGRSRLTFVVLVSVRE